MSRYESLQTRATRKLLPETLNELIQNDSPLLTEARPELAKYIQRTFRTKNKHGTYRKGSKMTVSAMRRQLYSAYANPGDRLHYFLLNTLYPIINSETQGPRDGPDKIKYLLDNLERPLLEKIYNHTWDLENVEEDIEHIGNPVYFKQLQEAGRRSTRKKPKRKRQKKTYKGGNPCPVPKNPTPSSYWPAPNNPIPKPDCQFQHFRPLVLSQFGGKSKRKSKKYKK